MRKVLSRQVLYVKDEETLEFVPLNEDEDAHVIIVVTTTVIKILIAVVITALVCLNL